MTALPEARLSREAELPYALIGMVTDYDCWREEAAFVEVAQVLDRMRATPPPRATRWRPLPAPSRLCGSRRRSTPFSTTRSSQHPTRAIRR